MKWDSWLGYLEKLPADAPAWDDFDAFIAAATTVASSKHHQRESARTALEEVLLSLQEREGDVLSRLGWADLSAWQSEVCSSSQALRLVTPLGHLQDLLEQYGEATRQIPATPQEFQSLRRTRNALEDEILAVGSTLDAFFADPQAEQDRENAAIPPVPEPELSPPAPFIPAALDTPSISVPPLETIVQGHLNGTTNGSNGSSKETPVQDAAPIQTPSLVVSEPAPQVLSSVAEQETIQEHQATPEITEPLTQQEPERVQLEAEPSVAASQEQISPTIAAEPEAAPTVAEASAVQQEPELARLETEPSVTAPQEQIAPPVASQPEIVPIQVEEAPPSPPQEVAISQEAVPSKNALVALPDAMEPPVAPLPASPEEEKKQTEEYQVEVIPASEEKTRRLRIFISSPGDVGQERVIAMRVVDHLKTEFSAYVDLDPILWEHEPLRATGHFQEQILAPSLSDIVVCILWSRLGTRLPTQFQRADGSLYASGTEWEFEDALDSYRKKGTPDLMVYRKSAEPHASMSDEKALLDRLAQKRALDSFIDRWFGNPQESFKAAFHQFSSPDEFEQVLENHLRKLIGERLPTHVTEDGAVGVLRWHKGSPFRGLQAFDMEHAPVFFGRTRAISEVSAQLNSRSLAGCAFVVIFGMSGSGKSSMVKAGLLPTLTQPGVVEGVGLWRWTTMMPSETRDPILGLAYALLQESALPELHAQGLDASELAGLLREAPQRVIGPMKAALRTTAETTAKQENLHGIPVTKLAIVVDQLEEIFTQEDLKPEDRRQFITVLQTLAQSGIVWVMATMRSDFFMRCAEIPELMELKEGLGQYHLLPPTFAELSQILTQPARSAGLRFEVDPQTGERLSDVLQDAAGKNPGALPLLEFTLEELFQKRTPQGILTFEAYNELGGIEGSIGRRAEEVFVSLPIEAQNELPAALRALVTVSEGLDGNEVQVGARRAALGPLMQDAARRQLVEAFVEARLLTIDQHESASEGPNDYSTQDMGIVRVSHEALLRHWPRLQKWLSDDLDFLRTRTRVMNSAAQWNESKRLGEYLLRQGRPLSEAEDLLMRRRVELEPATIGYIEESRRVVRRARNIRLGVVTGVIVSFLGVVSAFGLFSFTQWKKTEYQKEITERQKKMAMAAVSKWTYDVPAKLAGIPDTRPALKTIFQENIKLLNDVEEISPQTTGLQREKAANLDRMGDTWILLGDSSQAKHAYDESLGILTSLEKSEGTPASRRDLAVSLEKMGEVQQKQGNFPTAQKSFEQSLSLRRQLVYDAPKPDLKRELSVSYEKMGGIRRDLKDYEGCRRFLEQARTLRSELATNKNDVQAQRDLFVCAVGIGDSYIDEGKYEEARQNFLKILPLARTSANTGNSEARRDLAALYDRLGDVQVNENKAPEALVFYKQGLAISQDLARNQSDAQGQDDLLTSLNKVGNIYLNSGNPHAALDNFAKSLPLALNLANDKDNQEAQQTLLGCYIQIGDAQLQLGTFQLAYAAYQRGLTQYNQIIQHWPKDDGSRAQAAAAYGQLAYLNLQFKRPQEAITAATQGLFLAPDQKWITVNLVEAYVFSGQLAKAETLCTQNHDVKIQGVPFKQALVTDIGQIGKNGLTHPDFAKLSNFLLKN